MAPEPPSGNSSQSRLQQPRKLMEGFTVKTMANLRIRSDATFYCPIVIIVINSISDELRMWVLFI